ncbi:unnamed protein product [Gordionus sp. m RMFG-2023]|uniref:uncharacterized protein LOC135928599 n=1 Tax=Gordionus sp. m RMFG-2023 TaxID=3053472 RepID=UPI0030DDF67E
MNLKDSLLIGMYNYGLTIPNSIQKQAIKPIIDGYDIIIQSHLDTDKTTFVIGILQRLDTNLATCQSLIIVPTRFLASQLSNVFMVIGDHLNIQCHLCIGGTNVRADIEKLDTAQIVIGTPGRVQDMLTRNALKSSHINMIVLDQADLLLSNKLKITTEQILKCLPSKTQIIILSATMPAEILQPACQLVKQDCIKIFSEEAITLDKLEQFYIRVEEDWKFETLDYLLKNMDIFNNNMIIFCNTTKKINFILTKLKEKNYVATALYSNMDQQKCEIALQGFITGSTHILLCTDLITQTMQSGIVVSFILNYDFPYNKKRYFHRAKWATRKFGEVIGKVINLVSIRDMPKMKEIGSYCHAKIVEMPGIEIPKNVTSFLEPNSLLNVEKKIADPANPPIVTKSLLTRKDLIKLSKKIMDKVKHVLNDTSKPIPARVQHDAQFLNATIQELSESNSLEYLEMVMERAKRLAKTLSYKWNTPITYVSTVYNNYPICESRFQSSPKWRRGFLQASVTQSEHKEKT